MNGTQLMLIGNFPPILILLIFLLKQLKAFPLILYICKGQAHRRTLVRSAYLFIFFKKIETSFGLTKKGVQLSRVGQQKNSSPNSVGRVVVL